MSKDLGPYCKHSAHQMSDQRFMALSDRWKWKGYGLYWALKSLLRLAPTYELYKKYKELAKSLKTSEKIIKSIVEDFKLFEITPDVFYCIDLKEEMELMKIKSEKGRKAATERWKRERMRLAKHKREESTQQLGDILRQCN